MKIIVEVALALITALLLSGCNYLSCGTESQSMPIHGSLPSSTSTTEEVISAAESDNTSDVSRFDLSAGKNQHAPTVKLNSGYEMPVAGIGTYSLHDDTCVKALKSALEQGVRLIDTAYMYGNEKEVGQAVREFMTETGTPREEIDDFMAQVNIKPALVQNEIHPYYQEQKVIPYMHDLGIVMQAWYPLGGRGHQSELLNDETILKIAKAHDKSAAQVILRWDLQNGVVVIPGSSNPAHILENISLFDFELTDAEMSEIATLDRNEKHDWY